MREHKQPRMWKGLYVIIFILSTSMYLLIENGQRPSSAHLRKQILDLSQQYVRQLTEDMENGLDDPTVPSHDFSKPIAVLLFSLLKRIEYLEKQVNLTLEETLHLKELQKLKNCSDGWNSELIQGVFHHINKDLIQPDGTKKLVVINENTLDSSYSVGNDENINDKELANDRTL